MSSQEKTSVTVALRAPVEFKYGPEKEKTGWNVVSVDAKHKFVIFDDRIHAAIIEKLVEITHEYATIPPKKQGDAPQIVEIPGVVERKRGTGGGGRGPLLTDRQAALLAAAAGGADQVLLRADGYLKWLSGPASGSQATSVAAPAPPPMLSIEDRRTRLAYLGTLVELTSTDLAKMLPHYGHPSDGDLAVLDDEQLVDAITRLEARNSKAKAS